VVRLERENRTAFCRVKCPECQNEQLVFERASSRVDCVVCGEVLAEPTGGKAVIRGEILAIVK